MQYELEDLVKHRRGMLLLDRIIAETENGLVAEVTITPQSTFFDTDHVPAWVGVEYAAQAVAAFSGLRDLRNKGETKVGFLLSCRRYKVECSKFMLGDILSVHIEEEFNDGRMGAYNCALYKGQAKLAILTLSAYIPDSHEDMQELGA